MRSLLLIVRRELQERLRTKSFRFFTAGLFVLVLGAIVAIDKAPEVFGENVFSLGIPASTPEALRDAIEDLSLIEDIEVDLVPYESVEEAEGLLQTDELDALLAANFPTFFLSKGWASLVPHDQLWRFTRWWPEIVETAVAAKGGRAYLVPVNFGKLKPLTLKKKVERLIDPRQCLSKTLNLRRCSGVGDHYGTLRAAAFFLSEAWGPIRCKGRLGWGCSSLPQVGRGRARPRRNR